MKGAVGLIDIPEGGGLGSLNRNWPSVRLRFLAKISPSKSEVEGAAASTAVSFIPMEEVCEYGGIRAAQTRRFAEVATGYTYFREGDVLIAKITPCFENGKGAIAEGLVNGIGFGTTELDVLRPYSELDRRFLFYVTISHAFRRIGAGLMFGAGGQKRVPDDFVKNFRVCLPAVTHQRAIADFLDRETERIDNLIAKKQRQIELLQEKRAALISHAVTKGLDPNAKMKDSGVEWLGEIPEHWTIIRLKYVLVLSRGFDLPSDDFVLGPYPVCGSNGIIGYHDQYTTTGPCITVGRSGSVGEVNYYDENIWAHNTSLYVARFVKSQPRFASYLLKTLALKSLSEGTAVGTLNRNHVHDLVVTIPPYSEQKLIASFLDFKTEQIDRLVSKINTTICALREYRSALISAAVTGKIDVRGEVA